MRAGSPFFCAYIRVIKITREKSNKIFPNDR